MNVLLVVPWDNLGGVCTVVNQLATHLRANGHGAYYLLPGETIAPVEGVSRVGIPMLRMNLRPPAVAERPLRSRIAYAATLPATMKALRSIIDDRAIDVVNVHFPSDAAFDFARLRRSGRVKLVTSIHGADLLPQGARAPGAHRGVRALLSASDAVVSPSVAFQRAVRDAWPEARPVPMEAIPNGIDPQELGYDAAASDTTTAPPYVLSVLHLVRYKGVDVLIRAFAEVCGDFPGLRLKLVSGGPARAEFEALAAALRIESRVEFLGVLERPAVAAQLRGCTAFVLPSLSNSESFGIAAAEAMAVDRAVIVSRVGALPELVDDDVTGLIVPPGDVASLAAALRRVLRDSALRTRLGTAAGKRVRRDLPWNRTGTLYTDMFLRILGRPA